MSALRLSGEELAEKRKATLRAEAQAVRAIAGRAPRLVVALATDDGSALAYADAKRRAAESVGVDVDVVRLHGATTDTLMQRVAEWAKDDSIDAILIETPAAPGVDLRAVQDALPDAKDVDGAGALSLGRLFCGHPRFVPATAAAVMVLLDEHGIPLAGQRAAVIGRSLVVGRPLAQLLVARDATVTLCHSRTRDLAEITREVDVLCVAVGRPRFLTADMVKPGGVVVDVGTNAVDGKLVGDVDYAAVAAVAGAVSPVPGGVGPLTAVLLLENVVRAARARYERAES